MKFKIGDLVEVVSSFHHDKELAIIMAIDGAFFEDTVQYIGVMFQQELSFDLWWFKEDKLKHT